jgi:hypothetical protein
VERVEHQLVILDLDETAFLVPRTGFQKQERVPALVGGEEEQLSAPRGSDERIDALGNEAFVVIDLGFLE